MSFSCRDGERLRDGTPLAECVRLLDPLPRVARDRRQLHGAAHVESLLRTAARSTRKPLVAYPNSGESYDAARKAWSGIAETERWGELGRLWRDAGARLLGGCCRTGPDEVRSLRAALS